jgi:cytochrome c
VHGNTVDEMHDMNLSPTKEILVLATRLGGSSRAMAAGDAAASRGRPRSGSQRRSVPTQAGVNKLGSSLAGIVGSKNGTVPGFNFSAGMKNADITWDDAELDKFLASPTGDVHGARPGGASQ